jgi:hypothetical protein
MSRCTGSPSILDRFGIDTSIVIGSGSTTDSSPELVIFFTLEKYIYPPTKSMLKTMPRSLLLIAYVHTFRSLHLLPLMIHNFEFPLSLLFFHVSASLFAHSLSTFR